MAQPFPNKQLLDWVAKRRTDLTDEGLVRRFELWHAVDGDFGERLSVFDMETREDGEDPEDLVQEIWNDAVQDAATRPQGSHQRYAVKAFRSDGETPDEQKAFNVTGSLVSSAAGMSSSETPTQRGLLAQDMRMTDNMHAMMMRMAEGSAGQLAEQLRVAREENATLLYQRSRLLEIEQRLLDRTHEREMEKVEQAKSAERMDALIGLATTMLPVLLGKLFDGRPPAILGAANGSPPPPPPHAAGGAPPRGAPPEPPAPAPAAAGTPSSDHVRKVLLRDRGIDSLLGSLEPQQLQSLASALRPDQAMGFMEIYQSFREDHGGGGNPP